MNYDGPLLHAMVLTKLLVAATATRAYRKGHPATLMRCCQSWESVEKCFFSITFECINFHALSLIIANHTRGSIAEREDAMLNLD